MTMSMAASHAVGKSLSDAIFGASAAATKAAAEHGADKVTNATIGAIMDEEEKLACIPTMEEVFRSLPMTDMIAYAPISGLPGYLDAVVGLTFADQQPEGYVAGTCGGALSTITPFFSMITSRAINSTSETTWVAIRTILSKAMREI